jgi:Cu-Zn family superoxide dismutase
MNASARPRLLATTLLAALAAAGCNQAPPPPAEPPAPAEPAPPAEPTPPPAAPSASATIAGAGDSKVAGEVTVVPMGDGVHFNGTITGLAPDSDHGFHVHETGDCSDPANGSAGKHFNPGGGTHGGPDAASRHAGDMPNLHADASGNATVDVHLSGVGLGTRDALDVVGKAIVIHEGKDDYTTQPSGDSGKPIACGVISMPDAPMAATPDALPGAMPAEPSTH